MPLIQVAKPEYWTEEWCVVRLRYPPEEAQRIPGPLHVDLVHLYWVRTPGKSWRRDRSRSVASGRERIDRQAAQLGFTGRTRSVPVFTQSLGELRSWTEVLPGLRAAVEEAEASLPG